LSPDGRRVSRITDCRAVHGDDVPVRREPSKILPKAAQLFRPSVKERGPPAGPSRRFDRRESKAFDLDLAMANVLVVFTDGRTWFDPSLRH